MAKPNAKTPKGAQFPIVESKLINGTRLEVLYESTRTDEGKVRLISSFETMESATMMLISAPAQGELLYPLHEGDQISVNYTNKLALFSFDATVRGRVRQDNLIFLRVEPYGELHRTNRRQDFRLPVALQGVIELFDEEANKARGYVIHITDLSGGGASIQTDLELAIGDKTVVYIPMDNGVKPFPVEVRRCSRIQNPDTLYHYSVGLRFLFTSEREKDAMVAHVFRLQREVRKRV